MQFSIFNNTKKSVPKVPFEKIKKKVLGESYELSLVFVGDALSRRLNQVYRGKDKPTNVLSFPITKNSGEIFINLARAKPFGPAHLFIHGILHLKEMQHGAKMEKKERALLKAFGL
ncbi:MAG: rRNA maturation RNase YbeY [Patescibacteria group bacterium]